MATKEDELLEATIKMIAEKGLSGTTSEDVAKSVGCSSTLLYKYFDTNDVLIKKCAVRVKERHDEVVRGILNEVDRSAGPYQMNLFIFTEYIKRCSKMADDYRFRYEIAGTKYDWVLKDLSDRTNDLLFKELSEFIETEDETKMVDFIIKYSCTMMALNDFVRAVTSGAIPNTDENCYYLAKILCDGVGSFVFG